jgi:hypothetical protein
LEEDEKLGGEEMKECRIPGKQHQLPCVRYPG